MNHILKFRVWDKREKEFVTGDIHLATFYLSDSGGLFKDCEFDNIPDEVNPKNFIIQQFTGLKDKNGKEIYEGDILQENLGQEDLRNYKVEWGGDGWFLICIDKGWNLAKALELDGEEQPRMSFFYHNMIIIGNIFENPDLLI